MTCICCILLLLCHQGARGPVPILPAGCQPTMAADLEASAVGDPETSPAGGVGSGGWGFVGDGGAVDDMSAFNKLLGLVGHHPVAPAPDAQVCGDESYKFYF